MQAQRYRPEYGVLDPLLAQRAKDRSQSLLIQVP